MGGICVLNKISGNESREGNCWFYHHCQPACNDGVIRTRLNLHFSSRHTHTQVKFDNFLNMLQPIYILKIYTERNMTQEGKHLKMLEADPDINSWFQPLVESKSISAICETA